MPENRDADTYWNCNDEDIIASHEKYWKNRAKIMLSLLPKDVCSLMDFGCGNELCRELLSPNIKYYGLDMKRRNAETIVCDVNKEALPDIAYDCAYMAGFLYYIDNVPGFISKITSKYILCSFIGRELFQRYGASEIMGRLPGVRSMYYTHEFIHIFLEQGWKLINVSGSRGGINCFLFSKLI